MKSIMLLFVVCFACVWSVFSYLFGVLLCHCSFFFIVLLFVVSLCWFVSLFLVSVVICWCFVVLL